MKDHGTASSVPGWYSEFVGAVIRQLPRDIDPAIADGWINNQGALQKVLREALLPQYSLLVDYSRSVEDGVKAGRYNWSDPNISSCNFPVDRIGKSRVVIELIRLNRLIPNEAAPAEIEKMGYRFANIHEFLAFGENYPDIQRKFRVATVCSTRLVDCGYSRAPYLDLDGQNFKNRILGLSSFEDYWDEECRFAVVRKYGGDEEKAWCICRKCSVEGIGIPGSSCPWCPKGTLEKYYEHVSIERGLHLEGNPFVIRKSNTPIAGHYCILHQAEE